MAEQRIGMVGLGVMGAGLAENIAWHGYGVIGYDAGPDTRAAARTRFGSSGVRIVDSPGDLVSSLSSPRIIFMMVPAGKPVDSVIAGFRPLLTSGDILIDGGNSHWRDTGRRVSELADDGIRFLGVGVSGGEEGARLGTAIMPGGSSDAWDAVRPMLTAIAARADDGRPCCDWLGPDGAGHFVKMVHNGIEYGDMQIIGEAYSLLSRVAGLDAGKMSGIFADWNGGELSSYLIEITGDILAVSDPESGDPLVDRILDTAGQKGTGKWTSEAALDLGVPAPSLAEAVFARFLSALKEDRVSAASLLQGPDMPPVGDVERFTDQVRQALYAAKICLYAQGFNLLAAASDEYGWELPLGGIASLWRAGCIIRATFLDLITTAFTENPALPNLLLAPVFRDAVAQRQHAWREVVSSAARSGIPVPALSSALNVYDGYRTARLPANLLQAQRDYFGAHTYERIDRPRGTFFHTDWTAGDTS
jgi:6-phosphogluconate dehydrogenase